MVHLSGYNSKNYTAILRFKRKLAESGELSVTDPAAGESAASYREIDGFGEVAVKQVQKAQKRFTAGEAAVLAREYQAGKSTRELAQQFGCHRNTVSNVLKRYGFEVRGRGRQARGG